MKAPTRGRCASWPQSAELKEEKLLQYYNRRKQIVPAIENIEKVLISSSISQFRRFTVALGAAFRKCSAVSSAFLGAHRPSGSRWVCVTSSRELRSTCFNRFLNSRMTSALVTLGHAGSTVILAAQLSFVIFVLREEFAF